MDGFVGVKQGTRDIARLLGSIEAIRATGRSAQIYIASDLSATLTLGAPVDGLTSTNAWVFPGAMQSLVAAANRGDLRGMQRLHRALAPYRRALARIGQPAGVKAAMQIRGFDGARGFEQFFWHVCAGVGAAPRSTLLSATPSDPVGLREVFGVSHCGNAQR